MKNFVAAKLLGLAIFSSIQSSVFGVWKWECLQEGGYETCQRVQFSSPSQMNFEKCLLTCGKFRTLMPRPVKAELGKSVIYFLPGNVQPALQSCRDEICKMLNEALNLAKGSMERYHPDFGDKDLHTLSMSTDNQHHIIVHFSVSSLESFLKMTTDESYKLEITTQGKETKVMITAPTFFGARHALETLTQLIDFDQEQNIYQMLSSALIEDEPSFPYRGLIVDTARNFIPISQLHKILDAMSYNKLNTFHWHVSDSQTFPLEFKSYPNIALYGTYSPKQFYSQGEVKTLVQYARIRGIRVIPELDAPAHVGYGWQWTEQEGLGKLVVCLNKQPWTNYCAGPPCGQMNLANSNLYKILDRIYKELFEMFQPVEMFHFGGDEVNLNCWNSSQEMVQWMNKNNFGLDEDSYYKQWSVFQQKVKDLTTKANGGVEVPGILWTSSLTEHGRADKYLNAEDYIIQLWTKGDDPIIAELLQKKFKVIFSNYDALYLDCGVASWVSKGDNWCSPYKGWQTIYDNDITTMVRDLTGTNAYDKQVLGGEAAAWSEQLDVQTLDAKLWPRGAALAERLWTNPSTNFSEAENRMLQHRHRLVQRGIKAARLQPEWCRQNAAECKQPWKPLNEEVVEHQSVASESQTLIYNPYLLSYSALLFLGLIS